MTRSFLVRAASLTHYAEIATACGLDAPGMLSDVGLSASMLNEPDLMVPAERVAQLLENSAAASGVESFGLRMAETRKLSNLGPIGLLVRDQPTLRDSISVLIRYQAQLNGALSVNIEESAGVVVIREDVLVGGGQPVRQSIELAIGVMLRLVRQILGADWQPRCVCFSHEAPKDLGTHVRIFGAGLEFGHDFNGIVCARSDLDAVNPSADPEMARHAQAMLESLGDVRQVDALLDDVRRTVLLLMPNGRSSVEQVSAHLGIASRTVQRRLSEQGTSFSALVNDIRVDLAHRHVSRGMRPLTEIAGLLGFSAPSGFSRWYQMQFGRSPTQGRAAGTAGRT
jgi:AraC-like DNA-binding protein